MTVRPHADPEKRRACRRLREQRTIARGGRATRGILDLPAWTRAALDSLDHAREHLGQDRWSRTPDQVTAFVHDHGRLHKTTVGYPGQRRLAVWQSHQRAASHGREHTAWNPRRQTARDETVPGWDTAVHADSHMKPHTPTPAPTLVDGTLAGRRLAVWAANAAALGWLHDTHGQWPVAFRLS